MAAEAGVASALGGRGYAGYGRACTVAVRMGCWACGDASAGRGRHGHDCGGLCRPPL